MSTQVTQVWKKGLEVRETKDGQAYVVNASHKARFLKKSQVQNGKLKHELRTTYVVKKRPPRPTYAQRMSARNKRRIAEHQEGRCTCSPTHACPAVREQLVATA